MLRFRYAKANSHRFVSDLQTKAQAASSVIGTSIHLDSSVIYYYLFNLLDERFDTCVHVCAWTCNSIDAHLWCMGQVG